MTNGEYKYLGPRPGSRYHQYFINGTRIRAGVIYGLIAGPDQMTPEEAAANYNLPVDAVLECVDYCEKNADVLRQDWEQEEELIARTRAAHPEAFPKPPKS